jgi:hypothetical protein
VQALGGPPEVELVGDDREVAQVADQVDGPDDNSLAITDQPIAMLDIMAAP